MTCNKFAKLLGRTVTLAIVFVFLFVWLGGGFISEYVNGYNPNGKMIGAGGISTGWYSTSAEFVRDECTLTIRQGLEHGVMPDVTCDKTPVLNAQSNLLCSDVYDGGGGGGVTSRPYGSSASRDAWPRPCYSRVDCQGDVCKYNCKFILKDWTRLIDVQVTPKRANGKTFEVDVISVPGEYTSIPPVVMCDYILKWEDSTGDEGSKVKEEGLVTQRIKSIYINPMGTYRAVTGTIILYASLIAFGVAGIVSSVVACLDEEREQDVGQQPDQQPVQH